MCLEEYESFKVRGIKTWLSHFNWNSFVYASQQTVFVSSDLNRFELSCRGHDLKNALQLRSTTQRQQECLHRDVRNVVVRSNHGRLQWRHRVILFIKVDNLEFRKVLQGSLDEL